MNTVALLTSATTTTFGPNEYFVCSRVDSAREISFDTWNVA